MDKDYTSSTYWQFPQIFRRGTTKWLNSSKVNLVDDFIICLKYSLFQTGMTSQDPTGVALTLYQDSCYIEHIFIELYIEYSSSLTCNCLKPVLALKPNSLINVKTKTYKGFDKLMDSSEIHIVLCLVNFNSWLYWNHFDRFLLKITQRTICIQTSMRTSFLLWNLDP